MSRFTKGSIKKTANTEERIRRAQNAGLAYKLAINYGTHKEITQPLHHYVDIIDKTSQRIFNVQHKLSRDESITRGQALNLAVEEATKEHNSVYSITEEKLYSIYVKVYEYLKLIQTHTPEEIKAALDERES